jgi:hypothetical protein
MNMTEIINEFFENNIQPEQILHLGTMCYDRERWTDAAEEAFQQDYEDVFEAIGISHPEEYGDDGELWQLLRRNNKRGFLVQFATPNIEFLPNDSFVFSWGYYQTKWIYAETYEQACVQAIEWAKKEYQTAQDEFLESQADEDNDE